MRRRPMGGDGGRPAMSGWGGAGRDKELTSHYTTLGGPNTNRHYGNTLRGGNRDFHSGKDFLTSNEAFYGKSQQSARNRG